MKALEIRIIPRSNLTGNLNLVDLNRLPRFVYNYRTADWKGLKEDLVKIPWDTIYLMSSVDDVWEAWKTLFFQAVERNIQKKLIKRRRDVPWLNSDLKKLLHKKTLEEGEILWGSSEMGQL